MFPLVCGLRVQNPQCHLEYLLDGTTPLFIPTLLYWGDSAAALECSGIDIQALIAGITEKSCNAVKTGILIMHKWHDVNIAASVKSNVLEVSDAHADLSGLNSKILCIGSCTILLSHYSPLPSHSP